jgi:tight adherence protein B
MLSAALCLALSIAAAVWLLAGFAIQAGGAGAKLLGARTEADLAHLFVFIGARHLLVLSIALAAGWVALAAMFGAPWQAWCLPALAGAIAPRLAVKVLRQRRNRRISSQLPDALTLWAGLLRSGQSLMQALGQVASRQSGPLGEELRLVLGEQRMGVGLDVAFAALRDRIGAPDLRMLATLLSANRELGGNLAESLQRLANLLRNRLAMEARIQSLTAQGRLQGVVVGLLPVLLLGALYVMEPDAMRKLHTTVAGWMALGGIVVLEAIGFVLIHRIVKIDV